MTEQEECYRCWSLPLAQPVMMTAEDALTQHMRMLDRGCMHPVVLTVSFTEFCAIVKSVTGLGYPREALSIRLPSYGDLIVQTRPPPSPLPFAVRVWNGETSEMRTVFVEVP